MTARGRFISIEGGEGVGKSTQIAALAAFIEQKGFEVVLTREPGGTEGAETIRQLVLGGSAERWLPRAEALLFAAARSDHVERLIEPALARENGLYRTALSTAAAPIRVQALACRILILWRCTTSAAGVCCPTGL